MKVNNMREKYQTFTCSSIFAKYQINQFLSNTNTKALIVKIV